MIWNRDEFSIKISGGNILFHSLYIILHCKQIHKINTVYHNNVIFTNVKKDILDVFNQISGSKLKLMLSDCKRRK